MDAQKPQVGWTLSHLVFLARHTWQALTLLLRGYFASDAGWRGRFRASRGPLLESASRLGSTSLCSGIADQESKSVDCAPQDTHKAGSAYGPGRSKTSTRSKAKQSDAAAMKDNGDGAESGFGESRGRVLTSGKKGRYPRTGATLQLSVGFAARLFSPSVTSAPITLDPTTNPVRRRGEYRQEA